MKQRKRRGVVILDKSKYMEKCLAMLNTEHFRKLNRDPTKTAERKIQIFPKKIKSNLSTQEYSSLYPTVSCPGEFYDTGKIHKIKSYKATGKMRLMCLEVKMKQGRYH